MQFQIVTRHDHLRDGVEDMVRAVFQREYGASIAAFPDLMIAVIDRHGRPQCAAGLRNCRSGFFSECYLDAPLERAIGQHAADLVFRGDILELGSLAALRPGGLMALLRGFADTGLNSGYRWGVFTATARLRALAARLSIPLLDLGAASADRVPNPADWGSYYAQAPRVCAVEGVLAGSRLTLPAQSAGTLATPKFDAGAPAV